jgi:hypothetical protein
VPDVADLQQAAIDAAVRRVEESALAVRTRQRYDLVQGLKAQGKGIKHDQARDRAREGDRPPLLLRGKRR